MEEPPTREAKTPAPMYTSFSTFQTFLDWLQAMDPVPSQIDRSLWSTKFSGATGPQLMTGLRVLGLLDEEQPTSDLLALAKANKDDRKGLLKAMLRKAYGADFCDNLAMMTPKMVDDHLRELGTTDATHRKSLSFFLNASKEAGFSMVPAVAKRARRRPLGAGTKRRQKSQSYAKSPETRSSPDGGEEARPPRSMDELKIQWIEMLMEKAMDVGDADLYDRVDKLLGLQGDSDE